MKPSIWKPSYPFDPAKWPFFYGWMVVGLSALGILGSIPGQTVGISVFTEHLSEAMGISSLELATTYLIGTAMSGFLVPFGGKAFDRWGARKFIVFASVSFGLMLLIVSRIDVVAGWVRMILPLGTLAGLITGSLCFLGIRFLGQGLVTIGSRSMLSKWWNHRRGLVTAISGVIISFGFSIAPRVLAWEINLWGWRGAMVANACILLFVYSFIGWLMFRDNPEESGLEMDGGIQPKKKNTNPDTLFNRELTRSEAIRTYGFWVVSFAAGFQGLYATAYTFHVLDIADVAHIDREWLLNIFIWSSLVGISCNIIGGILVDYIRLRYIIVAFCLGGVASAYGASILGSGDAFPWIVGGMGLGWGLFPTVTNITFARYYGRLHLGSISGLSMAFMVWGSALGPVFFSTVKELTGSYSSAMQVSSGVFLLLAILSFFVSNPQRNISAAG